MNTALSLIHEDVSILGGRQWEYRFNSKFLDLLSKIECSSKLECKPLIEDPLKHIHQDLCAIIIIAKRLVWQKELWITNKLTEENWTDFAQLDVDHFFMKVSSIFDYVAETLDQVADNPTGIHEDYRDKGNFATLRQGMMNRKTGEENSINLGKELAELIKQVNWFDTIRQVRNSIMHKGSFTLVFADKNRILFQVTKCSEKLKSIPEIINDNVVDFELFAGLYFGYLLAFLEDFAINVEKRLPQNIRNRVHFPSTKLFEHFPTIFKWMKELLD